MIMNVKLSQAIKLFNAGQKQEALKLLSEVLKNDPSNIQAWYGMALCHEDIEKKKYCLNRVLALNPTHTKARQLLDNLIIFDTSDNPKLATQVSSPKEPVYKSYKTVLIASAIIITALIGVILTLLLSNPSKNASPVSILKKSTATFTPFPTLLPTPTPTPLPKVFEKNAKDYLPSQGEMPIGFILNPGAVEINFNNSSDSVTDAKIAYVDDSKATSGELYTVIYWGEIEKNEDTTKLVYKDQVDIVTVAKLFTPFETMMKQQGFDVKSKTDITELKLTASINNVQEYTAYNASYDYGIGTIGVYYLIFRNKNFLGSMMMWNLDPFSLGKYPTTGNSYSNTLAYFASLVTDKLVIQE